MNVIEEINQEYFLQDWEIPRYIFHGSKELHDVLTPRKAKCETRNPLNEQTAIYGSSIFKGAVPYAIGKEKYDCEIGYRPNDLVMKIYDGVIPEDDYGYVYVCDASSFSRCNDTCQYASSGDVIPIEVIKIKYADFKDCFEYTKDPDAVDDEQRIGI